MKRSNLSSLENSKFTGKFKSKIVQGRQYILENSYLCLNGGYTFSTSIMDHLWTWRSFRLWWHHIFCSSRRVIIVLLLMLSFLLFLMFLHLHLTVTSSIINMNIYLTISLTVSWLITSTNFNWHNWPAVRFDWC